MKEYKAAEIKNIALLGNSGVGKTSLSEVILYSGGIINRIGKVEDKNTVSDYFPVEQEYGNSVFSTILYTESNGEKINFIDTPGLADFSGSAVSAMNMCDTGLMLLSAQNGIEVGTEIMGRHASKLKKPLLFAINQLDHENTNFEQIIDQLKAKYKNKIVVVQFPVNPGHTYNQMIDVLKMKMYEWPSGGGKAKITDIPEAYKSQSEEYQNALIESAAECDDTLMEAFFENGTLNEHEILEGLQKGVLNNEIFPVLCLAVTKKMGVKRLMEFITNVLPNTDKTNFVTKDGKTQAYNEKGKTSLFVFKTSVEPHLGEVSFFKVMSGKVKEGQDLINSKTSNKERLAQLFVVAGKNRQKTSTLVAGDIGATVKLKNTKTGHSLAEKGNNILYPNIEFPQSKFSVAVKAQNDSHDEKLGEMLTRIHEEDPTLIIEYSKELKQLIVHGQGEFHLNTMKWRLENNDGIAIDFNPPKIPYRETITKQAVSSYRHKKQSGGAGQFGEVHMIVEPYEEGMPDIKQYKINGKEIKVSIRKKEDIKLNWGGKLIFQNCIVGGVIDNRFMPAILKGVMEKMEEGPLTGSYARDIRVSVFDGKMHTVDSNEISFMLAGRNAFSMAFKTAGPKILEPIYDIEILVPEEKMGDVMSDLQTRRALIMGMEAEDDFQKIKAKVPLNEIQRYSTSLSSITAGRAIFTKTFASYERVPNEVQDELLKAYEESQENE